MAADREANYTGGDFSPNKQLVLEFWAMVLSYGNKNKMAHMSNHQWTL